MGRTQYQRSLSGYRTAASPGHSRPSHATVLGAATTRIGRRGAGLGAGAAQSAAQANPADIVVDRLFRADPAAAPAPAAPGTAASTDPARTETSRLLSASFRESGDLSAADRTYVARLVAARTGLSQADAEKRVADVITEAKQALDKARKAAAQLALWLTAALLLGAFAASLAAVEGGQLRDGTWNGRELTPSPALNAGRHNSRPAPTTEGISWVVHPALADRVPIPIIILLALSCVSSCPMPGGARPPMPTVSSSGRPRQASRRPYTSRVAAGGSCHRRWQEPRGHDPRESQLSRIQGHSRTRFAGALGSGAALRRRARARQRNGA